MLKILPYDYYEVDAVEGWLDEQYRSGLALRSIHGRFCRFDRCEPCLTRCRLHVKPKLGYQGEEERIAQYREMGWEYVTMLTPKVDVYRAIRPDAVELNTDEELLRETLKTTLRTLLLNAVVSFLLPLYYLWTIISFGSSCTGFWDFYLHYGISFIVMCVGCCAIWLTLGITQLVSWYSIRRRSLLERHYHTPQRRKVRMRLWYATVVTGVLVLISCGVVWHYNSGSYTLLPVGAMDTCPVPTLSAICPEEAVRATIRCEKTTYPRYDCTLYHQEGPIHWVTENTGYGSYSYSVSVMDINTVRLAQNYAAEYTADWEVVDVSGYDSARFTVGSNTFSIGEQEITTHTQTLLLLKGSRVIEILYDGAASLTDNLALFAA